MALLSRQRMSLGASREGHRGAHRRTRREKAVRVFLTTGLCAFCVPPCLDKLDPALEDLSRRQEGGCGSCQRALEEVHRDPAQPDAEGQAEDNPVGKQGDFKYQRDLRADAYTDIVDEKGLRKRVGAKKYDQFTVKKLDRKWDGTGDGCTKSWTPARWPSSSRRSSPRRT